MDEPGKPVEAPTVSCEICHKEIPRSEARNVEAEGYVLHFCGIDCFDRWQRTRGEQGGAQ